jgi:hypothetical protein
MRRPALLLDVDGVLNPFDAPERPAGYAEYRYQPGLMWGPKGLRVWLNPRHGPMLRAFAERHGLELVWATTWEQQANEWIAPRIGLPALPVIRFGGGAMVKRPRVQEWAGDLPLAWIDDMFTALDYAWAHERGAPTLLVPVAPHVGLRDSDLKPIAEWAAQR